MNEAYLSNKVLVRPGVRLVIRNVENNHARVLGDSQRLSQVIANLVSNSAKFTERGEIVLGATIISKNEETCKIRFTVSDTGIGMSADTLSRVFQPFSQADSSSTRRYAGAGLGLPLTKRLVESMGSELKVSSAVGAGTTFTWYVR